tara:strand:+ start:1480 stop:5424 length:3945 start_codon:yes stop_codon:yes gene_type:complete
MIQLKLFKTKGVPSSAIFIDLYDTEPIKLTLSIEDITTADASSVFSKTFRVPATRNNNEFFKNVFEIDGIDYDVTVKKPAEILVDGAEFKSGHIRLQRIYVNGDQDKTDYELLFLGETRDLSSAIADKRMCDLVMTDFNWDGLPVSYSNADDFLGPYVYNDIAVSWNAYPNISTGTGLPAPLDAGYADGDILMPLIDHGNSYDTNGNPEQGRIALGNTGSGSFTHSANSLGQTRLKPMIRAKRIWDQIFEDAGYTYSSTFLNSDQFHQMYLSAFGNSESVGMNIEQTTNTVFNSVNQFTTGSAPQEFMYNPTVGSNVGGSFHIGSTGFGSYFVCPGDAGLAEGDNYYIMNASAEITARGEIGYNGDIGPLPTRVTLCKVNNLGSFQGATILATGNYQYYGLTSTFTWDSRNGGYQPLAGDILQVYYETDNQEIPETWLIENSQWNCTAAPGSYYSPLDLDCEYSQIDFIKDVLTMFRLVMQPDAKRPNNFIIEPWQDFIGSGKTYDWSEKINLAKDQILEPLFNTQSQEIEFTMQEDEDFINTFHQDNNKHAYGWLRFNSNNELLKGKRDIEVKGIAPTPLEQIDSAASGSHQAPDFILPLIHTHNDDTAANEHVPIKPKSRFLFYNGKQDITVQQDYWYINNDGGNPVQQQKYPLVSPYSDWPPQQTSLNLNFSNDTRYYISPNPGTGYFDQGSTLYDAYWSRYINSLYNKFSRRLTATFTLNNVDLQDFAFNDVIFVNGKYYRPEKIIDVQVGATTEVKCQLITLKDQRPVWLPDPLDGFSAITYNNNCIGASGSIQITTDGTPPFTWELQESGADGTVNFPLDQSPYTFVIDAPVGTDTLTVTDAVGRSAVIQVDVPESTATEITRTVTFTNPTVCEDPCNGTIDVVPSGGTGPYTIAWNEQDPQFNGFNLTGICPGQYLYNITDANGCVSDEFSITLACNDQESNYQVQALVNDVDCTHVGPLLVATIPNSVNVSPGNTIITLNEVDGCYIVVSGTQNLANYSYLAEYVDCDTCFSALPPPSNSWKVESCTTVGDFQYVPNNTSPSLSPGLVVAVTVGGIQSCYTVIDEVSNQPTYLIDMVFDDCQTCENSGEYIYFVEACDGSFGTYATSALNNITVGTIMQFTVSGTCVIVGQLVTGQTPTDILNDLTAYISCNDCTGTTPTQTCVEIYTSIAPASGTYIFNGSSFTWSLQGQSAISICAESNSVIILSGTATITTTTNNCTAPRQCSIQPPTTTYTVEDCDTSTLWTMDTQGSQFPLGAVIQYYANPFGTGATYCGTIVPVSSQMINATLANSFVSYFCGDSIHCAQ